MSIFGYIGPLMHAYNSLTTNVSLDCPMAPQLYSGTSPVSLHHVLTVILIVAPLGAILLPVIGVLIFFTPTESRRRPVFVLNIFACILGICQAIYFTSIYSYVVLHPRKPVSHTSAIAAIATLLIPPILVDSILLFRLLAFYPIQLTPRNTLLAIMAPTFLCKVARLACLIAFLVTYPVARLNRPSYAALPQLVWGRGPWIIALFALQALDNTYVSLFNYCTRPSVPQGLALTGICQICVITVPVQAVSLRIRYAEGT